MQSILQAYPNISYESIQSWWDTPQFFAYWCSQLKAAHPLESDTVCIFSAHSVPTSTVGNYEDEVILALHKIVKTLGLNHWYMAWQSAPSYGEWLGPTIESVIEKALSEGAKRIICIPFGFVSDHVEILYDNDIVCRNIVENAGATYERLPMPNSNLLFMEGMAQAIQERINK